MNIQAPDIAYKGDYKPPEKLHALNRGIMVYHLDDERFEAQARKHGEDPSKDGYYYRFELWGVLWKEAIYIRAGKESVFPHELGHATGQIKPE